MSYSRPTVSKRSAADDVRRERKPWSVGRYNSIWFVILGAVALVSAGFGGRINPLDAPLISAAIVLLLGVPHGAFDVAIWRHRNPRAGLQDLGQMLVAYVGLAAAFFGLWILVPELALPVFLAMSAIHFSDDWAGSLPPIPRGVVAVAMIASPAVFFSSDVIEIFTWLAPADVAERVAVTMRVIALTALQASLLIVIFVAPRDPLAALEITVVLALALLTPPMVFFLIYFCGLHSPRHMFATYNELRPVNTRAFLWASWPYAPLAIVGTVIGALVMSSLPVGAALLGAVFMALGALTVPHMLLIGHADGEPR